MSYLLWQLFWCLLGTAVLFFALGWLVRNWFKRSPSTENLINDSERDSWQTSVDVLKAKLGSETELRAAAEKVLSEHRRQLQAVSEELANKGAALDQRDQSLRQLQDRLAEMDSQLRASQTLAKERDGLDAQLVALTAQSGLRDQSLRAANEELARQKEHAADLEKQLAVAVSAGAEVMALRARVADLEPKVKASAESNLAMCEENDRLRTQVFDMTPKLAMAAAAGAEVMALRAHVADLEPQVSGLQNSDVDLSTLRTQLADLEQKLRASAAEVDRLKTQESELNKKLSKMQSSSADTARHLADLDARNRSLEDQLAAVATATTDIESLRSHVNELEGKLAKSQASEAELAKLRAQLAEESKKLKAHNDESEQLKIKLAAAVAAGGELNGKLAAANTKLAEDAQLRTRMAELEPQFQGTRDELTSFKRRWVELEGKFHAAQLKAHQYDTELTKLRFRIGELEPQVHQWETRYTTVVAEKDEELSKCRSRVAQLETKPVAAAAAVHQHALGKSERDDLKKIFGIGPVLEKRLNGLGVYFFREIAMWTREDVLRFEEHLKEFPDRIERDKWVEGARAEHFKKYGEELLKANAAQA